MSMSSGRGETRSIIHGRLCRGCPPRPMGLAAQRRERPPPGISFWTQGVFPARAGLGFGPRGERSELREWVGSHPQPPGTPDFKRHVV